MRFEATLLAALALLAPVPAAAQTAPSSGTPAAAPGGAAPESGGEEQGESANDEQGESSDQAKPASAAASKGNNESAAEQATDNASDEDDTPEVGSAPPLIPPAVDTLGGHVDLSASAGVAVPFGDLQQNVPQSRFMGVGWGFGGEVGYGISRSVVLGIWGQGLKLGGHSTCKSCSTTSFAVGPFVSYHLVQGTRFDPWMSVGVGFRTTKIAGAPAGDLSYSGLEWLRLRVGGDWYAFSKFGFGPYLELDAGHYLSRPSQMSGSASPHVAFTTGLRLIIDLPGK